MKASYKEHDLVVGFQQVHLMPGEFVFGLKKASKELRMTIQPIRTCLNMLKKSGNITIKTTNKFSIISIINWDTYQQTEITDNNQINKQLTNNQQTTNNKQECKNVKNEKKSIIHKDKFLECVFLSDKEVLKLKEKFHGNFDEALSELNNYKMSSGKKYDSDYHALIGWVFKKLEKETTKGGTLIL